MGTRKRRPFLLNVTRFGPGYWIGAFSTTLIGVMVMMASRQNPDDDNFPAILFLLTALGLVIAMLTGIVMSAIHLHSSIRLRDPNRVLGNSLGLLLCAWPFLLMGAAYIYYCFTGT